MSTGDFRPKEFTLKAGPIGLLLVHGFTGSTTEMVLVGNYLYERGLTILAPLLPGHGTTPQDLNQKRWFDWVQHVQAALTTLRSYCKTVFVGGLSLGSSLSAYIAATSDLVKGVVLYSPPTFLARPRSYLSPLKYLIQTLPKPKDFFADPEAEKKLWNYKVAPLKAYHELLKFINVSRSVLHKIECPVLAICSTKDTVIHPDSVRRTLAMVHSSQKELLVLHECGHVITLDSEWEHVASKTYEFISKFA